MVYVDLNVRSGSRVSVAELQRLGYSQVAVNAEFESDAKPKTADTVQSLSLTAITNDKAPPKAAKRAKLYTSNITNELQLKSTQNSHNKHGLRQLKRITIHVEDMTAAQAMNTSAILNSYDIVAARALSAKVFQFLCEQAEVDLITFDVTNRIPFPIKRPWIDAAIKRSVFFEITYTPCLGDSAGRRYFFSNASNLVRLTGGRHLIFSSGATRDILLRSPYDVINVGMLAGLTYGQAMDSIATNCLLVIEHAKKRRGVSGGVAVENTPADVTMIE